MTPGAEKLFADCARRRTRGLPLDGGSIPPISTDPPGLPWNPGGFLVSAALLARAGVPRAVWLCAELLTLEEWAGGVAGLAGAPRLHLQDHPDARAQDLVLGAVLFGEPRRIGDAE